MVQIINREKRNALTFFSNWLIVHIMDWLFGIMGLSLIRRIKVMYGEPMVYNFLHGETFVVSKNLIQISYSWY